MHQNKTAQIKCSSTCALLSIETLRKAIKLVVAQEGEFENRAQSERATLSRNFGLWRFWCTDQNQELSSQLQLHKH